MCGYAEATRHVPFDNLSVTPPLSSTAMFGSRPSNTSVLDALRAYAALELVEGARCHRCGWRAAAKRWHDASVRLGAERAHAEADAAASGGVSGDLLDRANATTSTSASFSSAGATTRRSGARRRSRKISGRSTIHAALEAEPLVRRTQEYRRSAVAQRRLADAIAREEDAVPCAAACDRIPQLGLEQAPRADLPPSVTHARNK